MGSPDRKQNLALAGSTSSEISALLEQMIEQRRDLRELDNNDLHDFAQRILSIYEEEGVDNAGSGSSSKQIVTPKALHMLEMLGVELVRRRSFKDAIKVYTLILRSEQQPRYYIERSNCYREEKLYV